MPSGKPPRPLIERFVEQMELSENGCWNWIGSKEKGGYGVIVERLGHLKKRQLKAHRVSYELFIGDIPADPAMRWTLKEVTVHHKCNNPSCVNPNHLALKPRDEHACEGFPAIAKARTHCPHGHEYTPENTKIRKLPNGRFGRACRECNRLNCIAYYQKAHGLPETYVPRSLPFKKRETT